MSHEVSNSLQSKQQQVVTQILTGWHHQGCLKTLPRHCCPNLTHTILVGNVGGNASSQQPATLVQQKTGVLVKSSTYSPKPAIALQPDSIYRHTAQAAVTTLFGILHQNKDEALLKSMYSGSCLQYRAKLMTG